MATIAIGDVHGQRPQLEDLVDQIEPTLVAGDTVVFLGDYIDRGPDTRGCVDVILRFIEASCADIVCLRGNHEDWMLRARRDHQHHSWLLGMDAVETIASYSHDVASTLEIAQRQAGLSLYTEQVSLPYDLFFTCLPEAHLQFFDSLREFHQTSDAFCAHAGVDPAVGDLATQSPRALVWGEGMFPIGYGGETIVVYGHRNNAVIDAAGWPRPRVLGRTIGIDTIAHGVLTAVRLPDGHVFQSARGARRA